MALQNFVDKVTTVATSWLNSVDVLLDTVFGSATTKAAARAALTSDAPMSLAQGGTGATTAAAARTNLGAAADSAVVHLAGAEAITGAKTFSGGITGYISITTSIAYGASALAANTTGANNVAIGVNANIANTTGSQNTAVGSGAGTNAATSSSNTAVGYLALSGAASSGHVAVGVSALQAGAQSGTSPSVAVGYAALMGAGTSTGGLAAVGYNAGSANTSGNGNTFLGANVGITFPTTGSNDTVIGYNAQASAAAASNEITLGNASIATLRCQVTTITALSDRRDKKDIAELKPGLSFIQALKPVEFTWNMRDRGKVDVPDIGFIAQDLQQVQKDLGVHIPGLVYESNPDKLEAGYGMLIPILVKAIQELKVEFDLYKKEHP